jgi:hypothetical protein
MSNHPHREENTASAKSGHDLGAWIYDALALGMGALAVFHYRPDGFIAGLIVFLGAYTLAHSLQNLNWQSLRGVSELLLCVLGVLIHLTTLLTAPASFTGLVFTFLLPGVAQAYWLWELWPSTGAWSHPLATMCAAWLALFGVWLLARTRFPIGSNRNPTDDR